MGPLSPTPLLYFLDSLPCASLGDFFCPFFPTRGPGSRLMKMCATAANAPPRQRSNRYVCKFTLGANVHGRHGRNVFTARVVGSCEWQIIPTLYLKHNFDGKFPIVTQNKCPPKAICSPRLTSEPGTFESLYRYHTTGQFPLNVPYSRSFYTYPIWGHS